nr:hypothetical protein [Streptomyces dioscori]
MDVAGLPAKPTGIGLMTGSGTVCATTESNPTIVSDPTRPDPTPALTATAQTAAGGEKDAQLRAYHDLDHKNSDSTWSDTTTGNGDLSPSSAVCIATVVCEGGVFLAGAEAVFVAGLGAHTADATDEERERGAIQFLTRTAKSEARRIAAGAL